MSDIGLVVAEIAFLATGPAFQQVGRGFFGREAIFLELRGDHVLAARLTLGLVLTFATSWIAYSQVVWNLATGAPDEIAAVRTDLELRQSSLRVGDG